MFLCESVSFCPPEWEKSCPTATQKFPWDATQGQVSTIPPESSFEAPPNLIEAQAGIWIRSVFQLGTYTREYLYWQGLELDDKLG